MVRGTSRARFVSVPQSRVKRSTYHEEADMNRVVDIGHLDPPDWSPNWSVGCLRDSYVVSGMDDVTSSPPSPARLPGKAP